jgi:hypothetical protein
MRIVFTTILMAIMGIIMFHLGMKSHKHLDKTIVLTTKAIKPSEGDLMRVQHVANDSVYLCIID